MRVVITRPQSDAKAWVDAVHSAGHQALALPLIEVGPAIQTQPIMQAWANWFKYQAVMFVSAQAVRYFFDNQPQEGRADARQAASATWKTGPRCWATGPGTHKALLQAGVPESCIDSPSVDAAQFDSEALWQRVAKRVKAGPPVLIVRGSDASSDTSTDAEVLAIGPSIENEQAKLALAPRGDSNLALSGKGRDWLAQQLQAAGASAQFVVAYERRPPLWSVEQKAQAMQAAIDGSVWCLSSSQAIEHLTQVLPMQSWTQARCIATHPRIAQTAKTLGFAEIHISRPSVADVLLSLECLA